MGGKKMNRQLHLFAIHLSALLILNDGTSWALALPAERKVQPCRANGVRLPSRRPTGVGRRELFGIMFCCSVSQSRRS
jgi:hypothetical protein